MLFIDRLFGTRDLLVPCFDFSTLLRANRESPVLKAIHDLRFDVFCVDNAQGEAGLGSQDGESDAYDDAAIHIAAFTRARELVGTVRLVRPDDSQHYPFEACCTLFDGVQRPARAQAAEISRLVVRKTVRRRAGDSLHGVSDEFARSGSAASIDPRPGRNEKRNNMPRLLLGLCREMLRYSRANGVRYWYAALDTALAGSLEKMGFSLTPIGPATGHENPVTPYLIDLDQLSARLARENRMLAAWFEDRPIPLWIAVRSLFGKM